MLVTVLDCFGVDLAARKIFDLSVILLAALTCAAGTSLFLAILYLWYGLHVHVPMADILGELRLVETVLDNGLAATSTEDWLGLHAGAHRITITRVLMTLDYLYLGGQNHLIYASAWLSIATILFVIVGAFRYSHPKETPHLIFVLGITLIYLSSHTQLSNLINPVNSSWYVAIAASTVAIWLLVKDAEAPTMTTMLCAYVVSAVGALSNFAGVIVWVLLPVFVVRKSSRVGVVAALISTLLLVLYLPGVETSAKVWSHKSPVAETLSEKENSPLVASLASFATRAEGIVSRTCKALGAPLTIKHKLAGVLLALFSLLVLIGGWSRFLIRPQPSDVRQDVCFKLALGITTLCLGVTIAAHIGRGGFSSAIVHRYQTVVMAYWLGSSALCTCWVLQGGARRPLLQVVNMVALLCVACVLMTSSFANVVLSQKLSDAAKRTTTLGILGVSDKNVYRWLLRKDRKDLLKQFQVFFRKHEVGYMADAAHQIDFDDFQDCHNVNLRARPAKWKGLVALTGTIADYSPIGGREIPVTTERGRVIGYLVAVAGKVTEEKLSLMPGKVQLEGYIEASEYNSGNLYLHFSRLLRSKLICRVAVVDKARAPKAD